MNCYHCDLPVLEPGWDLPIEGHTRSFCCGGCLAVAEHLHSQGLTQYYQIRQSPGMRPDQAAFDTDYLNALQDKFCRFLPDGNLRMDLAVEGITCGGCAWLIEHALDQLTGVQLSLVNLAEHRVLVHFDPQQTGLSQVLHALQQAGYRASPWAPSLQAERAKRQRHGDLKRLIIAGIAAMQAMMFAVALYASQGQFIEYRHEQLFRWISMLVSVPVMAYSAVPFYRNAYQALRAGRVNMDVPVSIALLLAWSASIWHVLSDQGEVYFDSVSMFAFFLLAGRFLEASMQRKALSASGLDRLPLPTLITREQAGQRERVDLDQIKVGDRVIWNAGEHLSVDGRITEGQGAISQALLTGESAPLQVQPGFTALAGALNGANPLVLEVTAVGEQRAMAQLETRSAEAQKQRPATLRWAERWSGRFVAFQLTVAGGSYLAWLAIDPSQAFEIALSVLVATCPCAFALAAPTALAAARAAAYRIGLVLLSPDALERLSRVTATVTDKTGTLTLGRPSVVQARYQEAPQALCDGVVAGLERGVAHPLARPFQSWPALPVNEVQVIEGQGVLGYHQGSVWKFGSASWVGHTAPEGTGWLGLTCDDRLQAWYQLEDKDRPGLSRALQRLPKPLRVLSGDTPAAVQAFCERHALHGLGGLAPEQKLEHLHQHDPAQTLALGDGINDAPLLASAGASIALTDASELTRAQCDGLVIGQDLNAVPDALELAQKTRRVIRQNLSWAIGYNASVLPLAMIGWLPAWGAALGMSLSSLLVVFNALRLRH